MTHRGLTRLAVLTATLCGLTIAPATEASASVASIKAVFVSYSPRIDVAEGRVLTALGEYKESTGPAEVESAIGGSVAVLGSLKRKVAEQRVGTHRARNAKRKIESGLRAVIVGYEDLSEAYAQRTSNPSAAVTEAKAAVARVKEGQKDLRAGVKLLG
jgi:hypothetical protein